MALQKEATNAAGATGSYWRSCQENVDKRTRLMHFVVLLFKDHDYAADLDSESVESKTYDVLFTREELMGDRTALVYVWLKANDPFFVDAADV